ncbi:NRDE-2, necessary for RNA interference-domain-containing protein [Tuber brumale]|nr:NRDE-2, necessary for RNA interference-domain-containing protein [Tuber brumale]
MASSKPENKPTGSAPRVIPKFSSFKPLAKVVTEEPEPAPSWAGGEHSKRDRKERGHRRRSRSRSRERNQDRDNDGRRERNKERNREDGRGRHGHRGSDRHHHNEKSSRREKPRSLTRTTVVATGKSRPPSPEAAAQRAFYTDTRSDPDNVTYGSIHRYSIPDYRRRGGGSVLGLSPEIRIDREKGDGKGLVLQERERRSGTNARRLFAAFESGVRVLRIKKGGGDSTIKVFENGMDFVPLFGSGRGRKRNITDFEQEESEGEDNHYRSLEGLKKLGENPEDGDLEYASASGSEGDYIAAEGWDNRQKTVELARKVDAAPGNVGAWLDYVNHQDTLLESSGRRTTVAERKSTAEVKLDILGKALEKCPGNEELLVKYMDIAQVVWDSRKMMTKWQRMLKENPTAIGLWTKYINFRQTDFLSFTYSECVRCFSECLATLRAAAMKAVDKSEDKEKIEEIILYVFLRTALLMKEAGFIENAIAAFQLMIELNFFAPPQITAPGSLSEHEEVLELLDTFWDSEVLRVGEVGAEGWFSFVQLGGKGKAPETQKGMVSPDSLDTRDPFGSWMAAEEGRMEIPKMPARTMDEVEEDDPYRVVLFSDLREFMFFFASEAVKQKLIDALLIFSGLRPLYEGVRMSSGKAEATDIFLRNELGHTMDECLGRWFWPERGGHNNELIGWGGMEPEKKAPFGEKPFQFSLRNFPLSEEMLFAKSEYWVSAIDGPGGLKGGNVEFVGNVLKMLVAQLSDEQLALYFLAWTWKNRPSSVKKVAKGLLKKFRTSLLLWNGYAQIEWRAGSADSARNVFSTALGMSVGFPEANRQDSIFLWKTWVWEELMHGDASRAVRVLLSIDAGRLLIDGDDELNLRGLPSALVLKARRHLEDSKGLMLSLGRVNHAIAFTEVRALLEYLVSNREVAASLPIYADFLTELDRRGLCGPNSAAHERCLMVEARLLYYHSSTSRLFKIKTMRDFLNNSLQMFPNNSVFLELFVWNEAKTKIENRARMLTRGVVLKEGTETILGYGFAIWTEMRMIGAGGRYNPHAVRALFEQAVETDRTKYNFSLWMIYVEFEIQERELKRAKEVLFRGIRNCPWSKDLVLLAFQRLRTVLTYEEMRKLLSIVSSEKELRVHDTTELEDYIDELTDEQRSKLGGTEAEGLRFLQLPSDASEGEVGD